MMMRSFQEVTLDQLPTGVLQERGQGRYSIQYVTSGIEIFVRIAVLAAFAGFPIFVWVAEIENEIDLHPTTEAIGAAGMIFAGIAIGTFFPAVVIDAETRRVVCGLRLLNYLPFAMIRYRIEDTDRVEVRVRDHHFGERHNPNYEIALRRPGFFRGDIVLLTVVYPPEDPAPKLLQFVGLVGQLLRISSDDELNTQGMKGSLPEFD